MLQGLKDVLLLKPAITTRNLVTVLLVVFMFGIYIVSGGKVTAVPKVKPGASFGSMSKGDAETQVEVSDKYATGKPTDSELDVRARMKKNLKNDPRRTPVVDYSEGIDAPAEGKLKKRKAAQVVAEEEVVEDDEIEEDGFAALEKRLKKSGF